MNDPIVDLAWLDPEQTTDTAHASTRHQRGVCCVGDWLLCNVWAPTFATFKRGLTPEDAPFNPTELTYKYLAPKADAAWAVQMDDDQRAKTCCSKGKPSFAGVMCSVAGHYLAFGILCGFIQGVLMGLFRPLLIKMIVDELGNLAPDLNLMCIYVLVMGIGLVVETFMAALAIRCVKDRWGNTFCVVAAHLVQRKSLSLKEGLSTMSAAVIIGNDINRMSNMLLYVSWISLGLTNLVTGVGLLLYVVGPWALTGLTTCLMVCLLNIYFGQLSRRQARVALQKADVRLGIMKEIMDGIKAIKLCAWESKFLEHITAARAAETIPIGGQRFLADFSVNLGRSSPTLGAATAFLAIAFFSPNLISPGAIFAAMNVFLGLRYPLIIIPEAVMALQQISVTFARIQHYLQLPEGYALRAMSDDGKKQFRNGDVVMALPRDGEFKYRTPDPHYEYNQHKRKRGSSGAGKSDKKLDDDRSPARNVDEKTERADVEMASANKSVVVRPSLGHKCSTTSSEFCLRIPSNGLEVRLGERVAVVGAVGSGKSTLLEAAMGNLDLVGNTDESKSFILDQVRVAFVPQKPFIIRGSMRLNIHMGSDLDDPQHLPRLASACANAGLMPDLPNIAGGIDAEVGGNTLSGGQMQRVCVARAMYHQSDLVILDDPLSAVDGEAAATILNALLARQHTCILMALNQVQFAHRFDRVLVMNCGVVVADISQAELPNALTDTRLQGLTTKARDLVAKMAAFAKTKTAPDAASVISDQEKPEKQPLQDQQKTQDGDQPESNTNRRTLTTAERRDQGATGSGTFTQYINGMGWGWFIFGCTLSAVAYGDMSFSDCWLSIWVNNVKISVKTAEAACNYTCTVDSSVMDHGPYVAVYGSGAAMFTVFLLCCATTFILGGVRSSKALHYDCLNTLMHAPVSWYDSTPAGRIISRFSADLGAVDLFLPRFLDWGIQFSFCALGLIIVLVVLLPGMTPVILASLLAFGVQALASCRAQREAKRDSNNAMTPVQGTLTEIKRGRLLIRVMRLESFFTARYRDAMDRLTRALYFTQSLSTWTTLTGNFIGIFISVPAALTVVLSNQGQVRALDKANADLGVNSTNRTANLINNANAGLALTYAFNVPFFLMAVTAVAGVLVVFLTSLERLLHYTDTGPGGVTQEAAWSSPADEQLPEGWPTRGDIEFSDATLVYRPGLPPALSNVNLTFKAGEKIGIVGPSGAGKSSLVTLLFRLLEPQSGVVRVDGQDISTLGLLTVRRAMCIIPQQPLLLKASVRKNLDPFNEHTTEQLANALEVVGLSPRLLRQGEGDDKSKATSLSAGEKQMLNLARAVLFKARILVCDEPTSNIDVATDRQLQQVIRERFEDCTVLTIAHRLETIVDYDRVVVMHAGTVAEVGPPLQLLLQEDPPIMFRQMAVSSGNLETLVAIASEAMSKLATDNVSRPSGLDPRVSKTDSSASIEMPTQTTDQ